VKRRGRRGLNEVPAGVEVIFGVIDELQDTVCVVSGLILLGQVEFRTVLDGCAALIRNHSNQRAFGIGLVLRRLDDDGQRAGVESDETADRDDPHAVDEELEQDRIERLAALSEHKLQHVRGGHGFPSVHPGGCHRVVTIGDRDDPAGDRLSPGNLEFGVS